MYLFILRQTRIMISIVLRTNWKLYTGVYVPGGKPAVIRPAFFRPFQLPTKYLIDENFLLTGNELNIIQKNCRNGRQ